MIHQSGFVLFPIQDVYLTPEVLKRLPTEPLEVWFKSGEHLQIRNPEFEDRAPIWDSPYDKQQKTLSELLEDYKPGSSDELYQTSLAAPLKSRQEVRDSVLKEIAAWASPYESVLPDTLASLPPALSLSESVEISLSGAWTPKSLKAALSLLPKGSGVVEYFLDEVKFRVPYSEPPGAKLPEIRYLSQEDLRVLGETSSGRELIEAFHARKERVLKAESVKKMYMAQLTALSLLFKPVDTVSTLFQKWR